LKLGGAPAWIYRVGHPATKRPFLDYRQFPSPSIAATTRGANLYSNSVLALDRTTALKWYFQFHQHDEHEIYDATQVPVVLVSPGQQNTC